MQTQWNVVTDMKGLIYTGLHYPSFAHVERRLGVTADAGTWAALDILEREGRRALNNRP